MRDDIRDTHNWVVVTCTLLFIVLSVIFILPDLIRHFR